MSGDAKCCTSSAIAIVAGHENQNPKRTARVPMTNVTNSIAVSGNGSQYRRPAANPHPISTANSGMKKKRPHPKARGLRLPLRDDVAENRVVQERPVVAERRGRRVRHHKGCKKRAPATNNAVHRRVWAAKLTATPHTSAAPTRTLPWMLAQRQRTGSVQRRGRRRASRACRIASRTTRAKSGTASTCALATITWPSIATATSVKIQARGSATPQRRGSGRR